MLSALQVCLSFAKQSLSEILKLFTVLQKMYSTVPCEDADRSEIPQDRSVRKSAYCKTYTAY